MPAALKPKVLSIPTGVPRYVARWLDVAPNHHFASLGDTVVEVVNGEVRRTAKGPYVTAVRILPDGRVLLLGQRDLAIWDGDTLTTLPFKDGDTVLDNVRPAGFDGANILLVGSPPESGVAYKAGLDGVVVDRCSRPGSHVFEDGRSAFFVEVSPESASVTAWAGGAPKSLGTLAVANMSPHPHPSVFRGRLVLCNNDLQAFLFGDGEARALGVAVVNPSMDDDGFVGTATGSFARSRGASGLVCRWGYDGTIAWEQPIHATGLRTVRSGNVFAAIDRDRIVLIDTRDGQLIADAKPKLSKVESMEGIVATARGAIVIVRRRSDTAKYAYLVEKGEAPIALKHEGVAGAMPFGHGMATWAGAADDTGALTLNVWNVAPAE